MPSSAAAEPVGPALILGSASPRRAALLSELGVDFEQHPVDIDEQVHEVGTDVAAIVEATALAKFDALAEAVGPDPRALLTSDTLVALDGAILAKPIDDAEVASMLRRVAGQVVDIATAVVIGRFGEPPAMRTVITRVGLRSITAREIEAYVASGIGRDKAGALSLQDGAAPFIDRLDRCWSNVVGLPLCAVQDVLDRDRTGRPAAQRCEGSRCGSGVSFDDALG